MFLLRLSFFVGIFLFAANFSLNAQIVWQGWSDSVFEQAKKEKKLVLLDLEAVWCHWCHVMAETTYKDPKMMEEINSHYVPVRVDQESRPDLASRYEDYGWPATILLDASGKDLRKLSGYLTSEEFLPILQKTFQDPRPEEFERRARSSIENTTPFLSQKLKSDLEQDHLQRYDSKNFVWGLGAKKFLDGDSAEYAFSKVLEGDRVQEKMLRDGLKAVLALLDPVWGGFYQYSHGYGWVHPHYEKIMLKQTEMLRIYSLAYAQWQDPLYLQTAEKIYSYLKNFLTSPEGAFYTSQDADFIPGEHAEGYFALDDRGRRAKGIPRVDTHLYARENGWVIEALSTLYSVTGNKVYLADAVKSAEWIIKNRSFSGGGFRHDNKDESGPYLGDTVSMGRAFLSLYTMTGERRWLIRAESAAQFIEKNFLEGPWYRKNPGFVTAVSKEKAFIIRQRDENAAVSRFANRLFHATGKIFYRSLAEQAMRYLSQPEVAEDGFPAIILLSDQELGKNPLHITIVGSKADPRSFSLFQEALKVPSMYRRMEWWDQKEGPMPNPDVQYPELEKPAAFVCTQGICSSPLFEPDQLRRKVVRLNAKLMPH